MGISILFLSCGLGRSASSPETVELPSPTGGEFCMCDRGILVSSFKGLSKDDRFSSGSCFLLKRVVYVFTMRGWHRTRNVNESVSRSLVFLVCQIKTNNVQTIQNNKTLWNEENRIYVKNIASVALRKSLSMVTTGIRGCEWSQMTVWLNFELTILSIKFKHRNRSLKVNTKLE